MRDGANLNQAQRTGEPGLIRKAGTEAGVEVSVQFSLLSWVAEGWKCWSEVTGRETMSFTLRGLGEMQREVFPFRI